MVEMNVLFENRLIGSLICSDRSKGIERESIKNGGEISYFYLLMRQLHQKEIDMGVYIVRRAPERFAF